MLTLTDTAKEAIHVLTDAGPADCGVRIATAASGNDGEGASVSLAVANAPETGDEIIEDSGARLYLQPAASRILGDQTLDATVDLNAQQVSFFVK